MTRETTFVEVSEGDSYLGAAMYLAIILYPDDISKRDKFVNACRAWLFKKATGGQLKKRIIQNEEILEFSDTRKIYTQFDKAGKIIVDKRLPALQLFKLQLMSKAINVTLSGDKKFTINKWIEKHYPTHESKGGGKHNEKNAYSRIWAPSKSIIHLVAGLENSITDKQKQLSIESLLMNPEWLSEAIKISENLRQIILMIKPINIQESQQIQVCVK